MKKSVKEHKEHSEVNEAGFARDMSTFTLAKDSVGVWHGSEAQRLLKT